jgi:UDP-N-acetylmuramate: L-alanyl-gamma-D-glutamyl-meso-diaminopimelate ligase
MDLISEVGETFVYDDFAHHPTAIRETLQGLRQKVGNDEIIAIIEPRSHTMSLGTLRDDLMRCCAPADAVYWFRSENIKWDLTEVVQACVVPAYQHDDLDKLIDALLKLPPKRRHLVIMSNGSFGDIYRKLPEKLETADRHQAGQR